MKQRRDRIAEWWWVQSGRYPEVWMLGIAALGWVAYFRSVSLRAPLLACHSATGAGGGALAHWLYMVAAMMLPTLVEPVRFVARNSLWRRRHRNIACFLLAYVLIWILAGQILTTIVSAGRAGLGGGVVPAALLLAAIWQVSPWKQRGMKDCQRGATLAARGWPATRDCLSYGMSLGVACGRSCWALMLVCAAAGHSPLAMFAVTTVVWSERMMPRVSPLRALPLFAVPGARAVAPHRRPIP